jgi:hypothetical protein
MRPHGTLLHLRRVHGQYRWRRRPRLRRPSDGCSPKSSCRTSTGWTKTCRNHSTVRTPIALQNKCRLTFLLSRQILASRDQSCEQTCPATFPRIILRIRLRCDRWSLRSNERTRPRYRGFPRAQEAHRGGICILLFRGTWSGRPGRGHGASRCRGAPQFGRKFHRSR